MATHNAKTAATNSYAVKVAYEDVAGSYGGWFLAVVQAPGLSDVDDGGNPSDGPSYGNYIANGVIRSQTGGAYDLYGLALHEHVTAKLEKLLGVGHTAKWSATIVQSVTPAVIDDNW
jgi:hypothetical protein